MSKLSISLLVVLLFFHSAFVSGAFSKTRPCPEKKMRCAMNSYPICVKYANGTMVTRPPSSQCPPCGPQYAGYRPGKCREQTFLGK